MGFRNGDVSSACRLPCPSMVAPGPYCKLYFHPRARRSACHASVLRSPQHGVEFPAVPKRPNGWRFCTIIASLLRRPLSQLLRSPNPARAAVRVLCTSPTLPVMPAVTLSATRLRTQLKHEHAACSAKPASAAPAHLAAAHPAGCRCSAHASRRRSVVVRGKCQCGLRTPACSLACMCSSMGVPPPPAQLLPLASVRALKTLRRSRPLLTHLPAPPSHLQCSLCRA